MFKSPMSRFGLALFLAAQLSSSIAHAECVLNLALRGDQSPVYGFYYAEDGKVYGGKSCNLGSDGVLRGCSPTTREEVPLASKGAARWNKIHISNRASCAASSSPLARVLKPAKVDATRKPLSTEGETLAVRPSKSKPPAIAFDGTLAKDPGQASAQAALLAGAASASPTSGNSAQPGTGRAPTGFEQGAPAPGARFNQPAQPSLAVRSPDSGAGLFGNGQRTTAPTVSAQVAPQGAGSVTAPVPQTEIARQPSDWTASVPLPNAEPASPADLPPSARAPAGGVSLTPVASRANYHSSLPQTAASGTPQSTANANADECAEATRLGLPCRKTERHGERRGSIGVENFVVDNSEAINKSMGIAGGVAVGAAGGVAMNNALQSGTISSVFGGAAGVTRTAAGVNAGGAVVNAFSYNVLRQYAARQRREGKAFDADRLGVVCMPGGTNCYIDPNQGYNKKPLTAQEQHEREQVIAKLTEEGYAANNPAAPKTKADFDKLLGAARAEKTKAADDARTKSYMSAMYAAAQAGAAILGFKTAKNMDKAAKDLANTAAPVPGFDGFNDNGGTDPSAPPATITGDGSPVSAAQTDDQAEADANGNLPDLNALPGDGLAQTLPNDRFEKSGGATPGAGGGGGLGGGGSTAAADPKANEERGAQAADSTRVKGDYVSGAGAMPISGGGGGGSRDSGMPDLGGMLAKLMGGGDDKAETEKARSRGILFNGRSPAGEEPISLLDRSANLFERIHKTYTEKNQRGYIGI